MAVKGATVTAVNTDEGAALEFSADDATSVEDVRRRVRAMADHHNAMAGARGGMGTAAPAPGMGRGGMMRGDGSFAPMPHGRVTVEETGRGARLVFTADDAEQRSALQQHIATRATHMQTGQTCPMGMMSMEGAASPTDDTR